MSGVVKASCREYRTCIFLILLICSILIQEKVSYAEVLELPEEVQVVEDEKEMIMCLIKGMRKHQPEFSFYYQGICKDFTMYQKNASYKDFFEKLSKKDGYITGIVSGYCIMICGEKKRYVTIQLCYLTTKRQEQKINKQVKRIVKRFGKGNVAKKAMLAHDYLIQHMQYDKRYYNPYFAFTKGKGMCMSYALAYQRIMQEMNIPCVYVKGVNHAWNMVKIGKYWYNVDVTWDDGKTGQYRYFLKSDNEFDEHRYVAPKWLSSLKKAPSSYKLSKIH